MQIAMNFSVTHFTSENHDNRNFRKHRASFSEKSYAEMN